MSVRQQLSKDDIGSSYLQFAHLVYLQAIWVEFVYEGHRVKVKITGAKKSTVHIPAT